MENLFHGVCRFEYKDGYVIPLRMTKAHEDMFYWHLPYVDRVRSTASVTIEVITSATKIAFDYNSPNLGTIIFSAYANGVLTEIVKRDSLSNGTVEFNFDSGEKHVEIYFHYSNVIGVKNFTANGEYKIVDEPKQKVLFYGDSITQGARAEQPGDTYVNVTKRALNYDILNWGIGGYVFDKDLIVETNFKPDKIIVSLGTNNFHADKETNERTIKEFFDKLNDVYKDVPVLALIPIWNGAATEKQVVESKRIKDLIYSCTALYKQMQAVSAYHMIPHEAKYYSDDLIHPNSLGMQTYGNNLVKTIKEIGF